MDTQTRKGLPIPKWLPAALTLVAVIVIIALGLANLTNRETVLLGVLQTILSIAIGWLITHSYAEDSQDSAIREVKEIYERNLRTYALKAAEKVENLSRALSNLANYLNSELEEEGYATPVDELAAKEERIYSAIHLINELKSFNDTSLSDWRGVIGDELDKRQEEAEERELALERMLDRFDTLEPDFQPLADSMIPGVARDLGELKSELRQLARQIGVPVISSKRSSKWPSTRFEMSCPVCASEISFMQRAKPGSLRSVECRNCQSSLIFQMQQDGSPSLRLRMSLDETFSCPECASEVVARIDEWPGSSATAQCAKCRSPIKVSRASTGLRAWVVNEPLSSEILQQVRDALPKQPWPKGVHKSVAESMGLSPKLVQKAIQQLIRNGTFMDQVNGVLCTPEEKLNLLRSAGSQLG